MLNSWATCIRRRVSGDISWCLHVYDVFVWLYGCVWMYEGVYEYFETRDMGQLLSMTETNGLDELRGSGSIS